MVDTLRQKLGSGVVVLASAEDGKVALIAAVTKDLTSKIHAGKIVQELAKLVGGSGGGRPDLAEAGGKDTSGIENALRPGIPPPRPIAIIPTAPEPYAGQSPVAGTSCVLAILELSSLPSVLAFPKGME